MRNMQLVGVSVLVVVGMGHGALAGGGKPAWCTDSMSGDESGLNSSEVSDQLAAVLALRCNPDKANGNAALDAATKKLEARFLMSDADWADVPAWLALSPSDQVELQPDVAHRRKAWTQLDPIEQFAMVSHPFVDAPNYNGLIDETYATDALGGRISEAGRLAYIQHCLRENAKPVEMAMCQPDIDALDGKKLAGELHAAGHTGAERMVIRAVYDQTMGAIAKRREDVKKLIASDPAYKQMFDIAKQQRSEWDARWKANPEALQLAAAMDDAAVTNSRKATAGCQDKTWHALIGAISKVPAKAFTAPRDADEVGRAGDFTYAHKLYRTFADALLSEPEPYLASSALATCYLLDPPKDPGNAPNIDVPSVVMSELNYWSGMRGPRTSTATRILQAGLQFDDRDAKVEVPEFHHYWNDGFSTGHGVFTGTVSEAKPKSDKVNLVFKTKDVKVYTSTGCHATNQVRGIMSNGQFDYVNVCTGAKVSIDHQGPEPVDVTKNFASVVKPGNLVLVIADTVLLVWKDPKAPPAYALGQPVK